MKKIYKFTAISVDGTLINDYIRTDNIALAKKAIQMMNYKIQRIEVDPFKTLFAFKERKIPLKNLKDIVSVFYNTTKQGISYSMVLDTLPEMFSGYTKKQVLRIKLLIQTQGLPLSKVFELVGMNVFIVKALEAAEKESGNVEEILGKIVTLLDILDKAEHSLNKALINPKIILTMILVIIYVIYGIVMKKALGFFQSHLTYGTVTSIIITITNIINYNLILSGIGTLLLIVGVWKILTSQTIFAISSFPNYLKYQFPDWDKYSISKSLIDIVSLILRPFEQMQNNYEIMKICFFIDLFYSSGVKPDIMVQYLAEIVDSKYTKRMLNSMLPNIRGGIPLQEAFKIAGFKKDFNGFIEAGLKTTQLSYYMLSYGSIKKDLFEKAVDTLVTVLPLIMMLFAGGFIIFTFAGIYLPMFNLK